MRRVRQHRHQGPVCSRAECVPNCGHHRRISAQEYIDLLVDEGSWHELDARLRSTDPLHFENYPQRLETAIQKAGPLEAVRTGYGRLDGMPLEIGRASCRERG